MKSVALVVRHGPGDHLGVREMVDMALVLATFDCPVSVVLQDDGVFWSTLPEFPDQHPISITGRLKSFPLYDIDTILIHDSSLTLRALTPHDDCPGAIATTAQISVCLQGTDCVLQA